MNQFFKLAILAPGALCVFTPQQRMEGHYTLAPVGGKNTNLDLTALQWINCLRCQEGSKPLRVSAPLTQAAREHSLDQSLQHTMTHTGSDNSSITERAKCQGYHFQVIAENIHHRSATIKEIMFDFFNSTGHMDNLADPLYEDFGAAEYNSYWTQAFGKAPTSDYPANAPPCPKNCLHIPFESSHFKNKTCEKKLL